MANTFELIQATTLGSDQTSVTLGSGGTIPQTYTDLCVKISGRDGSYGGTSSTVYFTFNGTSTGRTDRYILGSGSGTPASGTGAYMRLPNMPATGATANTFGSADLYIPNYTSAQYKSSSADVVSENNGTSAVAAFDANLWSNNAAITSITFTSDGNFASGSTFYLYGVKNA